MGVSKADERHALPPQIIKSTGDGTVKVQTLVSSNEVRELIRLCKQPKQAAKLKY